MSTPIVRLQPGEVVILSITGARFDKVVEDHAWFRLNEGGFSLAIPARSQEVTVLRDVPVDGVPRPGQLWTDADGAVMFAVEYGSGEVLLVDRAGNHHSWRSRHAGTAGPIRLHTGAAGPIRLGATSGTPQRPGETVADTAAIDAEDNPFQAVEGLHGGKIAVCRSSLAEPAAIWFEMVMPDPDGIHPTKVAMVELPDEQVQALILHLRRLLLVEQEANRQAARESLRMSAADDDTQVLPVWNDQL